THRRLVESVRAEGFDRHVEQLAPPLRGGETGGGHSIFGPEIRVHRTLPSGRATRRPRTLIYRGKLAALLTVLACGRFDGVTSHDRRGQQDRADDHRGND